jgi:hypothetical protein
MANKLVGVSPDADKKLAGLATIRTLEFINGHALSLFSHMMAIADSQDAPDGPHSGNSQRLFE